jgi:hypothetical protein
MQKELPKEAKPPKTKCPLVPQKRVTWERIPWLQKSEKV